MSARIHGQISMDFTQLWIYLEFYREWFPMNYQVHLEKVSDGLMHHALSIILNFNENQFLQRKISEMGIYLLLIQSS